MPLVSPLSGSPSSMATRSVSVCSVGSLVIGTHAVEDVR